VSESSHSFEAVLTVVQEEESFMRTTVKKGGGGNSSVFNSAQLSERRGNRKVKTW
jgi:hypothetical protein